MLSKLENSEEDLTEERRRHEETKNQLETTKRQLEAAEKVLTEQRDDFRNEHHFNIVLFVLKLALLTSLLSSKIEREFCIERGEKG